MTARGEPFIVLFIIRENESRVRRIKMLTSIVREKSSVLFFRIFCFYPVADNHTISDD